MISITRIVSLEKFSELCKDLSYSKLEIQPSNMKGFRDIKVICYYKVTMSEVLDLKALLKAQSANPSLDITIRQKIGGFHGNFSNNNMWMTLSDFSEMMKIQEENNINLGIPNKYKKLFKTLIDIE